MIRINLLPKEFRKKPVSVSFGKTGLYAVAVVAGVVVMLVGVTFYQIHQINKLESNIKKARQRAAMLERDIQMVDALFDVKNKISNRMLAVEQLDSHRSTWVKILQDIARNVPEFIWLGRVKEEARKDTVVQSADSEDQPSQPAPGPAPWVRRAEVEGYSFTLNALASFMINMMRSDYFDEVELVSTDEVILQDQKAYNFVLACNLHYLSDAELRDLIAQNTNPGDQWGGKTGHRGLN
jgi:type IV pilus assembly protein PilN